ncbi:TPA: fimbria/pilus outer membrane usher protein [Escherichia coli]|nr:fimbria/pilus outer membrane usher protein [Escherichia coli]
MKYFNIFVVGFISLYCNIGISAVYSFDPSQLNVSGKDIDLTLFNKGAQLPGIYQVKIIMNGSMIDLKEIEFNISHNTQGMPYLKSCLTHDMLVRYGVKVNEYPGLFPSYLVDKNSGKKNEQTCADLSAIPGATETYHYSSQQLLLDIPQVALQPKFKGIAPEILWDDGISAFLLNWQLDANHSHFRGYGNSSIDSFWGSLEPGFNIGPWRVRNLTTWNKSSDHTGSWESSYTHVERGLYHIKSKLTFGESYTPSYLFESVPFRGVMLGSDETMVPYSQREFAPVVRGIARTQSRIEVRQNGYLIHSLTVAAGEFSLTDLPVTGSGGDLEVKVIESDGTTQVFTVPFTTPAIALREGYIKYNIAGGQYRSSEDGVESSLLGTATVMYGLPWGITAFGGGQIAEHYQSSALGVGVSLGDFGALSLDGIHSRGQNKGRNIETGNSWRLRYDKTFDQSGTSLAIASYISSGGYQNLSDVLDTYRDKGEYLYNSNGRSHRLTLNLNQSLGSMGFVSLWGSRDEFSDGRTSRDSIGASYGTTWQDISWSVNWSRHLNMARYNTHLHGKKEDSISLWMSIPLERWLGNSVNDIRATAQIQRSTKQDAGGEVGMNGRAFDNRLYWDVRQQSTSGKKLNTNNRQLSLLWYGTYGEVSGIYSYSNYSKQMSIGLSGGLIAHRNGVTLGQMMGDTTVLIEAPGVSGASVNGGGPGIRTDFRGYTLVGWGVPYQENLLTLDPATFPDDADIPQTDIRVVPTEGAVVKARFITRVGERALLTLTRSDGSPLPFGAVVRAEGRYASDTFGIVGENGEVFMSGLAKSGRLKVQWGSKSQCYVDYQLPAYKSVGGISLTHSVCQ